MDDSTALLVKQNRILSSSHATDISFMGTKWSGCVGRGGGGVGGKLLPIHSLKSGCQRKPGKMLKMSTEGGQQN